MVSAFAPRLGLALGQENVADKSNEITAIPKLLKAREIKGCLVSIDAMGTQREIARSIRHQGADYLLAVKGNQPSKRWKTPSSVNQTMLKTSSNSARDVMSFRPAAPWPTAGK